MYYDLKWTTYDKQIFFLFVHNYRDTQKIQEILPI